MAKTPARRASLGTARRMSEAKDEFVALFAIIAAIVRGQIGRDHTVLAKEVDS